MAPYPTIDDWLELAELGFNLEAGPVAISEWFDGRYQVMDYIGYGQTCVVFRGIDTRLSRTVALKIWHGWDSGLAADILLKEGQILARIEHPNIVRVFDYGSDFPVTRSWLSLEYLGNRTLRHALGQSDTTQRLRLFGEFGLQLASAVDCLHTFYSLRQLDIKPDNVALLQDSRQVKLMDLGSSVDTSSTAPHRRLGTPGYIAPEVLSRDSVTEKADIFGLGVLFYELLTGSNSLLVLQNGLRSERPFPGRSPASVSLRMNTGALTDGYSDVRRAMEAFSPAKPLRKLGISEELVDLLVQMCAYEASDRPTASVVAQRIGALYGTTPNKELPSIFISHSHQDKERFVNRFADWLQARGFSVWVDSRSLRVGEPFWERIGEAINTVDFIAVVLSENSLRSLGVAEELRTAQLRNLEAIRILPIRIDPVDFVAFPPYLRSRHILDFVGWERGERFEQSMARLMTDILTLSGHK